MPIHFHVDCFSDPDIYRIYVNGKTYTFDFSERFGPSKCKKNGDICSVQNFSGNIYDAIQYWFDQGKQVSPEGLCIWDEPPDPHEGAIHIGGNHWFCGSQDAYDRIMKKVLGTTP